MKGWLVLPNSNDSGGRRVVERVMVAAWAIVSVLLVSLVLGQIQVEAKTCCPTTAALNFYNACRILGSSKKTCASLGGCKIISGNTCPKNYIYETLGNNGGDAVNEYCKLGCISSMCDPLTTLQDSGN
ncbi:hypothetical protein CsatB_006507 [Cannabis sativa]